MRYALDNNVLLLMLATIPWTGFYKTPEMFLCHKIVNIPLIKSKVKQPISQHLIGQYQSTLILLSFL